jgi:hypothetical protein
MPFQLDQLFKKAKRSNWIIIVSGLPRSGTSMMMKMLVAGGLEALTDNLRAADDNNRNGYYEFERVKKLKAGDYDWLPEAQGRVVKVISALLEFLPNQYQYKVIFMRRDMDEILSSQRQMLIRDGIAEGNVSDEKMAGLFGNHLAEIETWLEQQPNISTLYTSYNQIINDPQPNLTHINNFLRGNLDTGEMQKVIDQSLYRERKTG